MARFTGKTSDFTKFIGPRLRNWVTSISKKYRKDIGECESCPSTEKLEAAHIIGKDRKMLMELAYQKYLYSTDELLDVDLNEFELSFKNLHYPLKESFKILCRDCHREYDRNPEKKQKTVHLKIIEEFKNYQILEIQLFPNDEEKFKELFLQHKSASIKIIYADSTTETHVWKLTNFKATSNVKGNLRSRPKFRPKIWQKLNIKKVEVEINYKK